jgi:thioredoxin reductase
VAYRLLEAERWQGHDVVVVGGGNSAVEAAVALAAAGARTTLSYRGKAFARIAPENQRQLDALSGRSLRVVLESQLRRIEPQRVWIETAQGEQPLANDQVFVLIGGELPSEFLSKAGVHMRWHHGERPARPQAASSRERA